MLTRRVAYCISRHPTAEATESPAEAAELHAETVEESALSAGEATESLTGAANTQAETAKSSPAAVESILKLEGHLLKLQTTR